MAGIWHIIVPETTTNLVLNPSVEVDGGNYAALGGAVLANLDTETYTRYGSHSVRFTTAADNDGISFTLDTLANAIHYVTVRLRTPASPSWDWSLDDATYTAPTLLYDLGDSWSLYGLQFPAAQANASTTLYLRQDGAGAVQFIVDAIQVEELEYWTTYCDGDQEGCRWLGAPNASPSIRSALSTAGGRMQDLKDDYAFMVGQMIGSGTAPVSLNFNNFAILPGGEIQSVAIQPAVFTLAGVIQSADGDDVAGLHVKRQALVDLFKPDGAIATQGIRLRYTGAATMKEVKCFYEGGLEMSVKAPCYEGERAAMRFFCPDPYWRSIGETSDALDDYDGVTMRYCGARLISTGQWSGLGLAANPTIGGTINDIAFNPTDGRIYYVGSFVGWDGNANDDNVIAYNPITEAWETVGAAGAANNAIVCVKVSPNGDVYVGGSFTNLDNGDGNGDAIAYYDVSADQWESVSGGGVASVLDMVWATDGTLYFCGNFQNWNAIANADRIVSWDGAAYAALSSGLDNDGNSVAMDDAGILYVGGAFANAGGVACAYIAQWDGTAFSPVGTSGDLNGAVNALRYDRESGLLYVGGAFTDAGGVAGADYIAAWNGSSWEALSTGMDAAVYELEIAPDGSLFVGGDFSTAGGLDLTDSAAMWNGSSWTHLDADFPGAGILRGVAFASRDPVIKRNYDIYIGNNQTGTAGTAGDATVTNKGTADAFPIITVKRTGGTAMTLVSIRNETTGDWLWCDYALQDGETLTIDTTPTAKKITSDFSGPQPGAILPASDFGQFRLIPGANVLTCYVDASGGPTRELYCRWVERYNGVD